MIYIFKITFYLQDRNDNFDINSKLFIQKLNSFNLKLTKNEKIFLGENYFIIIKNYYNNNENNEVISFGSCFSSLDEKLQPKQIDFFNNIKIKKVICGKDITLFLTNDGNIYYIGTLTVYLFINNNNNNNYNNK